MAGITVLLFLLLSFTSMEAAEKPTASSGSSMVPAVYILGDSLADVGNNNHLLTKRKANFPHNSIDFAGGKATGRFSNGKNSADFISELLGLSSTSPYLAVIKNASNSQAFFNGVNFASGGAGILDATYKKAGNEREQTHLIKSVIVIGNNDIFSYINSDGGATPRQFVASLISTLQGHIKRIYNIGARKFAIVGTTLVGCCPSLRRESSTGECIAIANSVSNLYNEAVSTLLREMKSELGDMNYSFYNTILALQNIFDNPSH